MSQEVMGFEKSNVSTNDLSAKQYYIVAVDTSNDSAVVLAAAATDPIVGVLRNKPKAGAAAVYRFLGTSKVIAGGTITRGDFITSDANGKAITTTTASNATLGIALQSAVAGDIFEVQLNVGRY
jgi:Uncharacterized conserved protein (DUF2190)